jgi:hypothetical protein
MAMEQDDVMVTPLLPGWMRVQLGYANGGLLIAHVGKGEQAWLVKHLQSGTPIRGFRTLRIARVFAEALLAVAPDGYWEQDAKSVVASAPQAVRDVVNEAYKFREVKQ